MILSLHDTAIRNAAIAGSVTLVVAAVGLTTILTQASGTFAAAEPETATLSGGAAAIDDSSASGGKAIRFGAPAVTPTVPTTPTTPTTPTVPAPAADLTDSTKKDIAMQLVSSAENSSLNWKAQYGYIEYNVEGNAAENRGYTGGIIGFTSKTHDMLEMVQYYNKIAPGNVLAKYIAALQKADGTSSQAGLGAAFERDWAAAAKDTKFQQAQNDERDRVYFTPAVTLAKTDKLQALGQFAYYDAYVMHGPGNDALSFGGIRAAALKKAKTPAQGGDEKAYIAAFLAARKAAMLAEEGHSDTSRVDTMQTKFLNEGNLTLLKPLSWSVYGDPYTIK